MIDISSRPHSNVVLRIFSKIQIFCKALQVAGCGFVEVDSAVRSSASLACASALLLRYVVVWPLSLVPWWKGSIEAADRHVLFATTVHPSRYRSFAGCPALSDSYAASHSAQDATKTARAPPSAVVVVVVVVVIEQPHIYPCRRSMQDTNGHGVVRSVLPGPRLGICSSWNLRSTSHGGASFFLRWNDQGKNTRQTAPNNVIIDLTGPAIAAGTERPVGAGDHHRLLVFFGVVHVPGGVLSQSQ